MNVDPAAVYSGITAIGGVIVIATQINKPLMTVRELTSWREKQVDPFIAETRDELRKCSDFRAASTAVSKQSGGKGEGA